MRNTILVTLFTIFHPVAGMAAHGPIQDLPENQTAEFDVKVYRVDSTGQVNVFYDVLHDKTNSLTCDLNLPLPMAGGDEMRISLREVTILPREAFGAPVQYRLDAKLISDQNLERRFLRVYSKAAKCHGHDPREHLGETICRKVNPKHDQTCQSLDFGTYYPLLSRDTYLGTCECR